MPSRSAARHTSAASPVGSAAAINSNRRVCGGSAVTRRSKRSSMLPASGTAPARPNPPASSATVSPRGSSSSANGMPRVSATIWSRTRWSIGPLSTESSSVRASASGKPRTTSSGNPANWPLVSRAAKTTPTDSAPRRRATKASTCALAWSSHCASSTRHTSGRSSATCESRLSTARPIRNRSGAGPALMPNAVRSASRCGSGSESSRSSIGAHNWCSPANAISISDWTPAARATRQPGACAAAYSSSADFPTPASPCATSARLSPCLTASTRASSTPHSASRPISPAACRSTGEPPATCTSPTVYPPRSTTRPWLPTGG